MSLVSLKKISKNYGSKKVLEELDLTLEKGKIIGLLGPNGSGKTTLIKLLNGLLVPSEGEILIDGKHPGIESKKIVSYLPERTYLDPSQKVSELLLFFQDFYQDFDINKAKDLLEKLNINQKDFLKNMSKGMREKVQLVLVMSRKADLYILDEPIGGVDPATREYILDTILSSFKTDATILISTHLISDVERILDEVIFLSSGKVLMHKSADEIRSTSGKSIDHVFREVFGC